MNKFAISLGASLLCLAASGAYANGGVLTINGELTATTCTVKGNGASNDFTVTLPKVSTKLLATSNSTAGTTGFYIALSDCTPTTGKVHTFWEYGANTLPNGNLKNTGAAGNVEVRLIDANNGMTPIDVSKTDGMQNSAEVSIASGSATLQYAAQYISPNGGATVGSVSTTVTYSMAYQ